MLEEMSVTEKDSFQKELGQGGPTYTSYQEFAQIQKGIEYSVLSETLDKMEEWENDLKRDSKVEVKGVFDTIQSREKKTPQYFWAAVASFVAIFALVLFSFQKNHYRLVSAIDQHFIHEASNISGVRSAVVQPRHSPLKERAYNLYNIQEYRLAAKELEKVFNQEGDLKSLLFAAISNVGYGNLKKAEKQLSTYLVKNPRDMTAIKFQKMIDEIRSSK